MNQRLHLAIEGRVQGVSFRAYVLKEARKLQLGGWVRNLIDGRVEVEAEGPEEALHTLLDACRRGPMLARVEHVEAEWSAASGDFTGFNIIESD